jgi:hypothetical protein
MVALHYNVLVGVELFGKGKSLYLLPMVTLIITIANYILYKYLKKDKNFLAVLTIFASMAVQLIMLFAAYLLAQIN